MNNLYICYQVFSYLNCEDGVRDLGPELQCLLKVKEDVSYVFIFQDAKNNFQTDLKIKIVSFIR